MLKPLPIDRSAADASISVITFIAHVGFATQELAHMLDSLVRVSRRVEWNHLVTVKRCHGHAKSVGDEKSNPDFKQHLKSHNKVSEATLSEQYGGEFYKAHSHTRRQATMSQELSTPPH